MLHLGKFTSLYRKDVDTHTTEFRARRKCMPLWTPISATDQIFHDENFQKRNPNANYIGSYCRSLQGNSCGTLFFGAIGMKSADCNTLNWQLIIMKTFFFQQVARRQSPSVSEHQKKRNHSTRIRSAKISNGHIRRNLVSFKKLW